MPTNTRKDVLFVGVLLAATLAAGGYFAYRHRPPTRDRALAHVAAFQQEGPRAAARAMIERYGPPNVIAADTATWFDRGPWKRITIHGEAPLSYLEQVVSYHVTKDAAPRLLELDHGLRFDIAKEELSATSNSESLNFLALNLAHEVSSARRDPKDARERYVQTARLAAAGKSSPLLEKLEFDPYIPAPRGFDARGRERGY